MGKRDILEKFEILESRNFGKKLIQGKRDILEKKSKFRNLGILGKRDILGKKKDNFCRALLKSETLSIIRPPTDKSLVERIRQCIRIMSSPIFWSQSLTKVVTHYAMTLSLTVANDMMKNSVNAVQVGYNHIL